MGDETAEYMPPDLTKSSSVGVRWQAEMEEHLKRVRELDKVRSARIHQGEAVIISGKMQANAIAALALAVVNTVGDLELPISKIADAVERMGD